MKSLVKILLLKLSLGDTSNAHVPAWFTFELEHGDEIVFDICCPVDDER
jgi:hypothetical protein